LKISRNNQAERIIIRRIPSSSFYLISFYQLRSSFEAFSNDDSVNACLTDARPTFPIDARLITFTLNYESLPLRPFNYDRRRQQQLFDLSRDLCAQRVAASIDFSGRNQPTGSGLFRGALKEMHTVINGIAW